MALNDHIGHSQTYVTSIIHTKYEHMRIYDICVYIYNGLSSFTELLVNNHQ